MPGAAWGTHEAWSDVAPSETQQVAPCSAAPAPTAASPSAVRSPWAMTPGAMGVPRALHTSRPALSSSKKDKDEDDEEEDPDRDRHPYFPRLSQANKFQTQLEEAEVSKAWDGLFIAPWSDLVDMPWAVVQVGGG